MAALFGGVGASEPEPEKPVEKPTEAPA